MDLRRERVLAIEIDASKVGKTAVAESIRAK
jgi:hypothetical protein